MKKAFHGGVHPPDKKTLCSRLCIPPAPARVVIPLRQHIGAPCEPLVQAGDHVKMGQKLGGSGTQLPVHASVSGMVTAIGPMPHPTGGEVPAVIIENDGCDELSEEILPCPHPEKLSAEELFRIIHEAGIAGMGGAAFPAAVKAASARGRIDTLIVNACECEPYIASDDMLLRTDPRRVLSGAMLLAKALCPVHTVLAIEDNKPAAIASVNEHLADFPAIRLRILPTRYPQGSEKQLIQAITGREIPAGKLPADLGCCVFNPATLAAVHDAVYSGMPLIRRIVTVSGEAVHEPQCFLAPIGMLFSDLIKAAGGAKDSVKSIIAGGPMMGVAQEHTAVPVIKSTNCILCLSETHASPLPRCIRCGRCIEVCPVNLQPLYLYRYEAIHDHSALERLHASDCIECGCCSYICPGRLPLTERFRAGKKAIREAKTK